MAPMKAVGASRVGGMLAYTSSVVNNRGLFRMKFARARK